MMIYAMKFTSNYAKHSDLVSPDRYSTANIINLNKHVLTMLTSHINRAVSFNFESIDRVAV